VYDSPLERYLRGDSFWGLNDVVGQSLRISILENLHLGPQNGPEVKTTKNSKLPKLPKNCFERVGRGGWPPISTWITSELIFNSGKFLINKDA
jgi:hypothetical protein